MNEALVSMETEACASPATFWVPQFLHLKMALQDEMSQEGTDHQRLEQPCRQVATHPFLNTPYSSPPTCGGYSPTPSGCLKLRIVPNPTYTVLLPIPKFL